MIEFRTVVARPVQVNGLGLSIVAARVEIERLERFFVVLPETSAIYHAWQRIVLEYQVAGKPTYDARLVAAMKVHGVTSILTLYPSDFRRYAGIEVVDPATVLSSEGRGEQ